MSFHVTYVIVKVVIQVVAKETIDENRLAFEVVVQGGRFETGVQKASNLSKLSDSFVTQGMVEVAATGDLVKRSPVLTRQLVD